jgi:hypothetical protein
MRWSRGGGRIWCAPGVPLPESSRLLAGAAPPGSVGDAHVSKIGQVAYCGGNVYFVLRTAGVGAPFVAFTMSQCGFLVLAAAVRKYD